MVHTLEIVLVLLFTVFALEAVARRMALPSPFLLLPAGILLGYVAHFPRITLDPDLVLYVFLPLLVYAGAAFGSWGEFHKSIRPISLLAVGGVLFTTGFVALAAHFAIPGFSWPVAFVLGAIVSPPDEVAAISIARRLGIPKRLSAVLEGEGLVNDATALTIYRVATVAVVTHVFSLMKATAFFGAVVVGETAWGVLVGWAMLRIRRRVHNTSLEVGLSLLTPFIAYLPAEQLGGTGVLATVAAGLYVSYKNSQWVEATTRLSVTPVWGIIEFLLDGILFLVTGLQLRHILVPLTALNAAHLWAYGVGISLLVIVVRIVCVFPATYLPRWLSATIRKRDPAPPVGWVAVTSWSGMRGAISLAAALAIPLVTLSGAPFPQRDLMIFLTFCVIVSTLIVQGLSLPWVIHLFGVDRDGRGERSKDGHLEIEARRRAAEASLRLMAERRANDAYPKGLLDRFEEQYRYRHTQFSEHLAGDHDGAVQHGTHRFNLESELIDTERAVMLDMRREGAIDDSILRRIEKDLDLQEMRLRQGIAEWDLHSDAPRDNT